MTNLAIYSTYCGSNKNVTFRQAADSNYPRYFISNNEDFLRQVEAVGWKPILLENQPVVDDPIVSSTQAKIAKALPHLFPELAQYDYTIYIDDKVALNEPLLPGLVEKLKTDKSPMALKQHTFVDSNVLSEYTESLKQARYFAQHPMMKEYIAAMAAEGYSLKKDIHYVTTCILRDMKHEDTQAINNEWFEHIARCGIECQVSFFFISQMFENITTLPKDIFF